MHESDTIPEFDSEDFNVHAREVFQPFTPIKLVELFQGREKICNDFQSELSNEGRHVILYGDRGVGKTSFANLAGFWAKRDITKQVIVACHDSSNFKSILQSIFNELKLALSAKQVEREKQTSRGFSLGLGKASAKSDRSIRETEIYEPALDPSEITPYSAAYSIKDLGATIIIDEYDRFNCSSTDTALAEMIKRLSDMASPTKVVIVGVASTPTNLIASHPSLDRSCAQIKIPRMSRKEMERILKHGETKLDAQFPFEIVKRVLDVSDGFPFFVHLIALKMCEAYAGHHSRDNTLQRNFTRDDFQLGLESSIKHVEQSLRDSYTSATQSGNRVKDAAVMVLDGIALSGTTDVVTDDISYNMQLVYRNHNFSRHQIQSHINSLCKVSSGSILQKVRPACYKFSDPRMRAYVRLRLQNSKPELFTGQMTLPFDLVESDENKLSLQDRDLLVDLYSRIPNHTAESITYAPEFDVLHSEFCRQTGKSYTKQAVWRHLQNLRKAGRLTPEESAPPLSRFRISEWIRRKSKH